MQVTARNITLSALTLPQKSRALLAGILLDTLDKVVEPIDNAISEIIESPLAWPILEGDYRKHQLEHFPFGVIYRVVDDVIRVLAIMHLHRKPGYWEKRDSQF